MMLPEPSTVATVASLLLHEPPKAPSFNVCAAPMPHNKVLPVIVPASGNGFTKTSVVANTVPQPLDAI